MSSFRLLRLSFVAWLLCHALAVRADDDNTLTWCQFNLPPVYIVSGPKAGQGIMDGYVSFFIKKLPNSYRHRFQLSNLARIQTELREGKPLLCAGLQRNEERDTYALYSEPFDIIQSPHLLLPASKLALLKPWLGSNGLLPLDKLPAVLDGSGLVLGITSGRSYGPALDKQIATIKDHPRVMTRLTADGVGEGLIRMMQLGRIDAAITFVTEDMQYRELYQSGNDPLIGVGIDGLPRFSTIHVLAPKTDWGRKLIGQLNAIIRSNWNDAEFRFNTFISGHQGEDRAQVQSMLREIDPNRKR
ncbi:hypothetical protein [Uliginosibacterium sediminicola]|uniref:Solute-binding protein family 3/N-terminal domain-containing protein n=1 Tax=Uliginosibacterium sediminicola TaxID=2024550 RepID=A0ABU9YZE9_9RHOO